MVRLVTSDFSILNSKNSSLGACEPVKLNHFVFFTFQNFSFISRTVPGKTKNMIPFIYFVCKPFLQSGRCGKEFIQNRRRTSNRVFQRIQLLFAHLSSTINDQILCGCNYNKLIEGTKIISKVFAKYFDCGKMTQITPCG